MQLAYQEVEAFSAPERAVFEGYEISYDPVASNIRYIVPRGYGVNLDLVGMVHPDVKMRVDLGRLVISQLPTSIIFPGVELTNTLISSCLRYSNKVMNDIGLPQSSDLYIRSRPSSPDFVLGRVSPLPIYSRRSLIIKNAGVLMAQRSVEFDDATHGMVGFSSPYAWQKSLYRGAMLMIHSEDEVLQKKCLHGVVGRVDGDIEAFIGDQRIHARGLVERPGDKPFVRLRGTDVTSALTVKDEAVRTYSNEPDALRLTQRWLAMRRRVATFYEIVTDFWGRDASMEFRIYPEGHDGVLQVLDVDVGF